MKNKFKEIDILKKPFGKRFILMLIGVVVMGMGVAVLNLTNFGVDPFAAFSYGMSDLTGMSFGTTELVFNGLLLLIVIYFDVSKLGLGTIGNMVIVGYTADFTTFVMKKMGIVSIDNFAVRLIVMLIALIIFIFAVALYINAGLGASAYDVLPYIIHEKLCVATQKEIPFKFVRMAFDAVFTIIGFALKGAAGVITVLMVISLGPVIEFVAKLLSKVLKLDNRGER